MQNIKNTIDFVCNIFNYFGINEISSEIIRQSKFNTNKYVKKK